MTRDFEDVGNRKKGAKAWLTALALAPALVAAPLYAMQAVAPPQVAPTLPPAQAQAPIPTPILSPAQAGQLRLMLDDNAMEQGLRSVPPPPGPPLDNAALVRAALDHARAVHSGRLAAVDFDHNWGMKPQAYDPLPGFADAVRRDRLAAWIAALPPPYAGYDGLVKGLENYRAIAAAGGWAKLDPGPDLTLGSTGPRVLALRQRLAVEDKTVVLTGDTLDADLQAAVQRAQRRYGLNPAGVVSAKTLAALNVPATDRVRQIMANLER